MADYPRWKFIDYEIVPENPQLGTNGPFRFVRRSFANAGVDNWTKPPAQSADLFSQLTNVMPVTAGILTRRWGYNLWGSPALAARHMFEYQNTTSGTRRIILTATTNVLARNEDGTSYNANIFTPGGGAGNPRMVASRDYAYFVDGLSADLKKWDGSAAGGVTGWGITAPITALSVGAPVAGAITIVTGRKYYVVYRNSTTTHMSDLSPISASTGPLTAQNVPLTNIPISADAQVDKKWILATKDGGDATLLYFVAEVTNATASLTDNVPEATLLASNVVFEVDAFGIERGVTDNTPPPNGTVPTKHNGRLWMLFGEYVYFSKSIAELTTSSGLITGRYEEAWPATNFFDVSSQAETPKGLLSYGGILFIATERRIFQLLGTDATNFQEPEVIFNDVGLVNPDVWKPVFIQGAPAGAMWMTPDFRVIQSDMNTYKDVGFPIQTTLNSVNTAQTSKIHAVFMANQAYDLYILAIPTGANTECDTLCVYDMRSQRWFIWTLADTPTAMLFEVTTAGVPQLLLSAATGSAYIFGAGNAQDRVGNVPVNITATAQTSWLEMQSPATRKHLNEIDLMTGDSGLLVTVEGANTDADFASPVAITTNQALATGPLGTYKIYLAGATSKHRYNRLTFTSNATATDILDYYNIEVVPGTHI